MTQVSRLPRDIQDYLNAHLEEKADFILGCDAKIDPTAYSMKLEECAQNKKF